MMLINCEWMMRRERIGNPLTKKEKFPQSLMMKFNINIPFLFLGLGYLSSFSQG